MSGGTEPYITGQVDVALDMVITIYDGLVASSLVIHDQCDEADIALQPCDRDKVGLFVASLINPTPPPLILSTLLYFNKRDLPSRNLSQ